MSEKLIRGFHTRKGLLKLPEFTSIFVSIPNQKVYLFVCVIRALFFIYFVESENKTNRTRAHSIQIGVVSSYLVSHSILCVWHGVGMVICLSFETFSSLETRIICNVLMLLIFPFESIHNICCFTFVFLSPLMGYAP